MNKEDIYKFLDSKNIWYVVTDHKAVYNMDDLKSISFPYVGCDAKNLFVRDDKKKNYYLIVVKGNKKVDLKEFKNKNNTRSLSFASSDDLFSILGLVPGSVSPFGILNDCDRRVSVFFDEDLFLNEGIIGVHPNDNTATVWIKVLDLVELLRKHGNIVNITSI